MGNLFKRIFKIGEAKANKAVDNLENPVEQWEQAIRDMTKGLDTAKTNQIKLKTVIVTLRTNEEKLREKEKLNKTKANRLLDKVDAGELDPTRGEELTIEALNLSENAGKEADVIKAQRLNHEKSLDKIVKDMREYKNEIKKAKNELVSIEAREAAADASIEINKNMGDMGGADSAKAMMDKMRAKVEKKEAEATALDELDDVQDVESEIDSILAGDSPTANNDLLAKLRSERNK